MYACITIPDFSAEAILRFEPELRQRAVVVLAGRPPLERVVGMNENARQLGVEMGALKAQLEAWEDFHPSGPKAGPLGTPALVLRTRSESQENSAHAALLDCAQSFSPEVEDTTPDAVLLNLAGLEPLFGPPSQIVHKLAERAWQMGMKINVGAAANPDAAFLAAHGFSGVTLIAEGHEAEFLGRLPVDVLFECFSTDADQASRWLETFERWGVRNLRALAALSEIPVSERLGQQGIRLQKLARGAIQRKLRLFESPPVFEEHVELEYPIVLLEPLAFLLNRTLEQVCARLEARALAAQELRLTLELAQGVDPEEQGLKPSLSESDNAGLKARSSTAVSGILLDNDTAAKARSSTFTRTLRLPVPMLNAKMFLKLLQLDLQAHPPGAPIVKIHLSAEPARQRAGQSGLFQPVFPESEKLELTLARIAGIVGEGRVGSAELLDTYREDAFEMRHFAPVEPETKPSGHQQGDVAVQEGVTVQQKVNLDCREQENVCEDEDLKFPPDPESSEFPVLSSSSDAQERMSAVIALRLFRPPLRAVVNICEGKPVRLKCIHREEILGDIVWSAGPWRSSGDWSEQEGWSREEWDIAVPVESGLALYRLVEDRLSRNWFVEGMYD